MSSITSSDVLTESSAYSYIFVGPPKSGKTVLFVVMMDRFKRKCDADELPCTLHFRDSKSLSFVDDSIDKMKAGKWPAQTVRGGVYEFDVNMPGRFWNIDRVLSFHDHPG